MSKAEMIGELMFKARTTYGLNERTICDIVDQVFGWKDTYKLLMEARHV